MFFILNLLIFYQIQIDEGQTLFIAVPKVNKITNLKITNREMKKKFKKKLLTRFLSRNLYECLILRLRLNS